MAYKDFMLISKLFTCVCFLLATTITQIHSIQVLPSNPGFGPRAGEALGQGLGNGIRQGIEEARIRKREERNRKQAEEKRAKQIEHERSILEEMLKDYAPENNSDYILRILQSDLSNNTKVAITAILNEQHRLYLEEQKQKKGWFWSWFKK